jgi:hypothetical protein
LVCPEYPGHLSGVRWRLIRFLGHAVILAGQQHVKTLFRCQAAGRGDSMRAWGMGVGGLAARRS